MTPELKLQLGTFGHTQLDGLVLPAGAEQYVTLVDEQTFILVILRGRLLVSREDTKKTWRQVCGSPTAPVILTTPGTYRIVAERHSVALRAERC